ncbi:hypothetical protein ACKUB1_15930 [Methanospirillum stamsii]|uniref:DUF4129 domain-containing protein n=1 Tax=Methanospirillum stamsii TaxID=1277351 RepID=A0A2V2MZK5_9EURY|nr:hypothetical protein [Methanospirillum stamsii]PWR71760.1 hypothetical protein DLD82_13500 [Methanospirillum stamsii]
MKISHISLITFFSLTITALYLLSLGSNPILYSLELEKPTTEFHSDINAEERIFLNSSQDMTPIMQDILDYSGPIALNIRMEDMDAAIGDLQQYYNKYRNLDRLVINLDMSESEIEEFQDNTKLQEELFRELLMASDDLDTLKRLEFRYRDQNDITSLKTVAFQGEALKKKIHKIREKYNLVNEEIVNQGMKFELNTSKVEQARMDINRFVDEITEEQEVRKKEIPITNQEIPEKKLTLLVTPESGKYWDVIHYSGYLSGTDISNKNITLNVDNTYYTDLLTNDIGHYSSYIYIEQISTGPHNFTSVYQSLKSEQQPLFVTPVNSTIDLYIQAVENQPVVNLTGNLLTHVQVNNATVHSIVNNASWNTTLTNQYGNYFTNLTLPQGTYQIYTAFNDNSYPIHPNQSQVYEVVSSGTSILSIRLLGEIDPLIIFIIVTGGVVGLTGIIIIIFRKYVKKLTFQSSEPKTGSNDYQFIETIDEELLAYTERALSDHYLIVLQKKGLSEAAREVYQIILTNITFTIPRKEVNAHTIREISEILSSKPYSNIFSAFTRIYEKIRYGGSEKVDDKENFETQFEELDQAVRKEE